MAALLLDVSMEVGKALAEGYAKDMWDQVNNNTYGDAEKSTQAILASIKNTQHAIIQELKADMLHQELTQHMTHIQSWTKDLADFLLAKHNNEKDADEDLARLDRDLQDTTNGIAFVLDRMDSLLRNTTPISNEGLIKLRCQKLDEELADPKQLDKDMCWYLIEINKFLTAAIRWQIAGLALRLFTARGDSPKADRHMREWRTTIDTQLDYTRESYHPMIKCFKFSFWDNIPESRLWRLRVPKGPDTFFGFIKGHEKYLYRSPEGIIATGTADYSQIFDPKTHFKFSPPLDKPNSQNQSGQWSCLENAAAPGQKICGKLVETVLPGGRASSSEWIWETRPDMPSHRVCPRYKLCPVDKDSKGFKLVADCEAECRRGSLTGFVNTYMFWDHVFEADHVEGTGWL